MMWTTTHASVEQMQKLWEKGYFKVRVVHPEIDYWQEHPKDSRGHCSYKNRKGGKIEFQMVWNDDGKAGFPHVEMSDGRHRYDLYNDIPKEIIDHLTKIGTKAHKRFWAGLEIV